MAERQIITRAEAIERGLIRYFTGKPCKHGHISERYVLGNACVECTNESYRKNNERNNAVRRIANMSPEQLATLRTKQSTQRERILAIRKAVREGNQS